MKVLVSSYACEPHKGSEPYVGWTWTRAIACVADEVHVITRANNREPIEEALKKEKQSNVCFHYFDLPGWSRFWKKGARGTAVYYFLWQYAICRLAIRLHHQHNFDAVHHLTFAGMTLPPGIASVPAPFIWGPIGGLRVPKVLKPHLHTSARFSEAVHDAAMMLARCEPRVRKAFRRASVILKFPRANLICSTSAIVIPTGSIFVDPDTIPTRKVAREKNSPLHGVSAFRMIFLKGGDLGIEAIALLKKRNVNVHWTMIGDGPERRRWQDLARKLGVEDRIDFIGWLARDKALEMLSTGDFLFQPAYRQGWSAETIEAMAMGLPVVCLDWGDTAYIVDANCGFKVPVPSREAIVEGLADSIEQIGDPILRNRMGKAARQRVMDNFTLRVLDRTVESIYAAV